MRFVDIVRKRGKSALVPRTRPEAGDGGPVRFGCGPSPPGKAIGDRECHPIHGRRWGWLGTYVRRNKGACALSAAQHAGNGGPFD